MIAGKLRAHYHKQFNGQRRRASGPWAISHTERGGWVGGGGGGRRQNDKFATRREFLRARAKALLRIVCN